jgi:hypothetical protein
LALCVVEKTVGLNSTKFLSVVDENPCTGFLLLSEQDLQSHLSFNEVSLLFGAAASLYALVYVFKLSRRLLGF